MLITRRLGHEPALATDDAARALAAHDWTRPDGALFGYFPVARGNPFQDMLYSRLRPGGLTPLPTYDLATTGQVASMVAGAGVDFVVHLHWLNFVLAKAPDETDARGRVKAFLDELAQLCDTGARLLWTVHNILPHETRYPDLDAGLRQGVVSLAERVHVMSPRTRELVAPWFDIPAHKELSVPHPCYQDAYPSWMPRAQARAELGLPDGVTVFLLLGRVQPYKGITELLDAFDRLCEREPGRYALLVAGPAGAEPETLAFRDRLRAHPTAHASLRKIPVEEMQVYLRAADIAVLPYRRSLNSGARALALTFGLPAVVRDDAAPGLRLEANHTLRYDGRTAHGDPAYTGGTLVDSTAANSTAGSVDGLLEALGEAGRVLTTPQARASAAATAARLAPARVSAAFAAAVREWLGLEVAAEHLPKHIQGQDPEHVQGGTP
ncbi:glycosyltransferase [Actinopolymorpha sp. NPDC004070]|uniref:glycosyltransferase n=1 Tax=Actinopolymorpha sp. NPDC004070 TaxID=3154548 RepID=UPI0033AEE77B